MVLYYAVCVACDEVTQPSALESSALPRPHTLICSQAYRGRQNTILGTYGRERGQKMPFSDPSPISSWRKKEWIFGFKINGYDDVSNSMQGIIRGGGQVMEGRGNKFRIWKSTAPVI
jgi:hypothetical protein